MSVYIMMARELGVAKIGFTRSPARRLEEFQTACPAELELVALIPADASCERQIQDHFEHIRKRGEWFYITPEIEKLAEAFACGDAFKARRNGNVKVADQRRHLSKKRKSNAVAFGVEKRRNRYRARIKVNGKSHHLGTYGTIEEATAAYWQAANSIAKSGSAQPFPDLSHTPLSQER